MNIKKQQIHNYQQLNLKKQNKTNLSKQAEQEQNHKCGDHLQGYQREGEEGEWEKRCRD